MSRKSWGLCRSEIREFSWNISLVQILVEVAIIQMRTLKTEVEKGFLSTVIVQELAAPKR